MAPGVDAHWSATRRVSVRHDPMTSRLIGAMGWAATSTGAPAGPTGSARSDPSRVGSGSATG
jgi:hypothetical protein